MDPNPKDGVPNENTVDVVNSAVTDGQDGSSSSHHPIQDEKSVEMVDGQELPAPVTTGPTLLIWNKPRINLWRFLVTLLCFFNMGANDAAYGVGILPDFVASEC
jgi:hypothetical protein